MELIKNIKTEILSGLTVALSLVPEAISFALIVGVSPLAGLWAAVFMALSSAFFGGIPGIISGATGATAVILAGVVTTYGVDHLYVAVMLAGILQLIIWLTRAYKLFEHIPKVVISGFLTGLAIMIFMGQLRYLQINDPNIIQLIVTICVVLMAAIAMWISSKKYKFPPALIAIAIGCSGIPLGLANIGNISTFAATLPTFTFPVFTLSMILNVLPYSLGVAVAGLTESLLTVDSVSEKLNLPGSKRKETFAQGVGNVVSSMFSTIGGCVLVGQTNLNISSGAKTRLSSITAGIFLIFIIMLFSNIISIIPIAGLIGVMLNVVLQTADIKSLYNRKWNDLLVILVTIMSSLITHNLAVGVVLGTALYFLLNKIWISKINTI